MTKAQLETLAVQPTKIYDERTGAISMPIFQSATFKHKGLGQSTGYDYARLQNPTREAVEKTIASLEGGAAALAFATGMAAINTLTKLFNAGDHVILSDDLYGGTYRLFEDIYKKYGIASSYCDMATTSNLPLQKNTVAIIIESPTNPMMKIADIVGIAKIAKQKNILVIVDNTIMTPYFQSPLELGADVVVHSGTKYLAGHNDTLSGFLVVNDIALEEKLRFIQKSEGANLSPFDSWLVLRGIKTLALRMEKHATSATKIAAFLSNHKQVTKVFHPSLLEGNEKKLYEQQCRGVSGVLSFYVKDTATVARVLSGVKLISFAESLGGVESLITYPMTQTHDAIPATIRDKIGVTDTLLRLSVGIENVDDIIVDLNNALN